MSRNGPHTSTKKLSWWKSSNKDFCDLHDSKREEKILSSSDFVTAASMVQQIGELESCDIAQRETRSRSDGPLWLIRRQRFARLPWVIYTSHSPYSHYCTD